MLTFTLCCTIVILIIMLCASMDTTNDLLMELDRTKNELHKCTYNKRDALLQLIKDVEKGYLGE